MTTTEVAAALRLSHVDAGYGSRMAIRDVSFAIRPGQRVGLIGPNGAGKSTLFSVALGTLAPWRGDVEVFGAPINELDRRRQPVAYVPQARRLDTTFPVTAREVVAMGRVGRLGLFRFPTAEDRAVVERSIDEVGLAELADRPFAAFSGGQQQRLLVARALASEARLLFLDEPATGVDVSTQRQLDDVVDRLVGSGCAALVSTHDLSVENLARFDWLICLNREVLAQGRPDEVTNLAVWRLLFGGQAAERVEGGA